MRKGSGKRTAAACVAGMVIALAAGLCTQSVVAAYTGDVETCAEFDDITAER
ncbi:MAG: hypothetical protein IJ468_08725 [Lachnospiraceae bacterium]|nr:hypothetical protein [Lachnospiraceae bacterium]